MPPFKTTLSSFSRRIYWREILACLLLAIGIYFFRQQRRELASIYTYLGHAQRSWLLLATLFTALFILLQSAMYVSSFRAIGKKLSWMHAIELFLKRNLLGVFLPGGGVTALAYTPVNIRRAVGEKIKVQQASVLFAFAGMLSTFIVGLPVLFLNASRQTGHSLVGLGLIALLILLVLYMFDALRKKKKLYHFVSRRMPALAQRIHELTDGSISRPHFYTAILSSVGVELCGIVHLYLSMLAVGAPASLGAAGIAYIISLLLMVSSPFLKGLGAVELSVVYVLTQFGYTPAEALAIAFIYRFFEFWLPLLSGLLAFLLKGKQIFARVLPAVLILLLGLVNIISVATPPVAERLHLVRSFVPVTAIHASNLFVLFIGLTLTVTAAFLIKGMRNAWWIAVVISFLSIPGHLIKALDYEEAIIALVVFITLMLTRKQYKGRGHRRQVNTGFAAAVITFLAVLVYGFVGFYFLEKRHFGVDFSWRQSIEQSVGGFFLLNPDNLHPLTRFGREFLRSFHVLGLLTWLFLLYSLIRPYLQFGPRSQSARERAKALLELHGRSSVDHFKLSEDKLIFLSKDQEGFVSYRVARNFAVVLEEPVCAPDRKPSVLKEFDAFAHARGWKTAFYRVDEQAVGYFARERKKKLLIGQEALLDVQTFELSGKARKNLRNGLNSLQKKGYTTSLRPAPHEPAFLDALEAVSNEWLRVYRRREMIFAQGSFDRNALKDQDIICTFDPEGCPVAFLNIIPDFTPGECTYDLIRKTAAAPGGCMDALIVALAADARARGLQYINLGLVPMSGIVQPENPAEQVIRFAYNKVRRFRQYRGLREFKEKYASVWQNKYLIYENDFDLLQLPAALNRVMQTARKEG